MPLHPFIEVMLEKLAAQPGLSEQPPEAGRAQIAAGREAVGKGPEMAEVRELSIPTRSGEIPGRLLVPSAEPAGLIVYYHGGGWVLACIDDFDTMGRQLAADSGCAVLLVEYRLAPEHPFPAPLEDCEDALLHAAELARSAFARPVPVAVAGDSAGANLATVSARRLKGRVEVAVQALIYPVTDCDFDRPSYRERSDGMPLKRADMEWFFGHYAPREAWASPDISPLRTKDLSGLPPAVVTLAEYDVLRDEGLAYAQALEAAGVPVTLREAPGLTHGFIRLHNLCAPVAEELAAIGRDIAKACEAARAEA
ncbi:alpha/beta hydrolase [Albimonas sp. CAU 1670]|uniref:alpha/beta hydrolase n=1 Tax=Albimonas sp. CAU 1670 TaxID=3032599 RepID=UPI0023D9A825|nr:alpha/beta hydrolase [Albimonas sp. CAU 1670]MDF2234498.1 alpha/beta hydrolase [Albimonas sp. CAU 1670]